MSFWQRITGAVILLIVLLYVGDYLFVRFRMAYPRIGSAFGTVQMRRLYAIPLKNGKIEYEFDALQTHGYHAVCPRFISAQGQSAVLVPQAEEPEAHSYGYNAWSAPVAQLGRASGFELDANSIQVVASVALTSFTGAGF